mgnify:CR=1 FL=1
MFHIGIFCSRIFAALKAGCWNKTFAPYNFFTVDPSVQKQSLYKDAAEGITVMKLNKNEIQRINSERPEALEMNFPFEGRNITL